MIQVWIYDKNNVFTESTFVDDVLENMTTVPLLVGYIKPTFNGAEWVEGATQAEIDEWHESNKPPVTEPDKISILEKEVERLTADNETLKVNDKTLLSSTFDLDFRVMEIEFVIDSVQPQAGTYKLNMRGSVNMAAMTPYEMARTLILADAYERADMEYKISVYVKRGRMTQAEADELISLMDANELTQ